MTSTAKSCMSPVKKSRNHRFPPPPLSVGACRQGVSVAAGRALQVLRTGCFRYRGLLVGRRGFICPQPAAGVVLPRTMQQNPPHRLPFCERVAGHVFDFAFFGRLRSVLLMPAASFSDCSAPLKSGRRLVFHATFRIFIRENF